MLANIEAEAAEQVSQITRLIGDFGLDATFLIAQIINFCIVAFIIYYFGFRPVLATIDERQKKIADGLQYAEEMRKRLAEAEKQYTEKMDEAARESQNILHEARESAKSYLERQMQEAAAEAEAMSAKAREVLKLEQQQMVSEARKEVARLVIQTASKVLSRELSSDEVAKFNEAAAKELYAYN